MRNTCKILWSKRAQSSLERIIEYLEENRTERDIQNFSRKPEHCISILETNPEAFPKSRVKPGLRRVVISRQNTLFYAIKEDTVFLVKIFDTRQNPKRI
jgi:plasmid stabilization system protein ParE